MQDEAEAATLLDAKNLPALSDPLADLGDEFRARELARRLRAGVIFLGDGHGELEMDIEAELEAGPGGIERRGGQRAGGPGAGAAQRACRGRACGLGLRGSWWV